MSKQTITPGPWWVRKRKQADKYPELHTNLIMAKYDGHEVVVAEIDNADEDAQAIAAVPDMVETLKDVYRHLATLEYDVDDNNESLAYMKKIETTLRKAGQIE